MYSRGSGRIGSSGFEHVFLAEIKNGHVSGLHNWIYFNEEEKKNFANYLGYMKKLDLGGVSCFLVLVNIFQFCLVVSGIKMFGSFNYFNKHLISLFLIGTHNVSHKVSVFVEIFVKL